MQNIPGDYHGDEDEKMLYTEECPECYGWDRWCNICHGSGEIEIDEEYYDE